MANYVVLFLIGVSFIVTLFRNRKSIDSSCTLACYCESDSSLSRDCMTSTSKLQQLHVWGSNHERKWKSHNMVENEEITTVESEAHHPWIVAREVEGPDECKTWQGLWNIYLDNGENKLFASYDALDDRLTLQREGTKQQSFILGVGPTGLFLIKSNDKTKNRFLKMVGEQVKMVELTSEESLNSTFEWDIAHPDLTTKDFLLRNSVTRTVIIKKSDAINTEWGHDVVIGDMIPVKTYASNYQQCWKMTSTMVDLKVTLTFDKYCPNTTTGQLIWWNSSAVILSPSDTNNARGFVANYNGSRLTLQKDALSNGSKYLGISGEYLNWTSKRNVKTWFMEVSQAENFISLEPIRPSTEL